MSPAALATMLTVLAVAVALPRRRGVRRSSGGTGAEAWRGTQATVAGWWRRRTAASRRDAQLPEGLERVASALRAGLSLPGALAAAGSATPLPLGAELTAIASAARRGQPLAAAVDDWAGAHASAPVRMASAALAMGAEAGGAVARAVDGVAASLRERRSVAAEAGSLATQARASAALIAVAPLAFSLLVGVADPSAAAMLVRTPVGLACLGGGLALELAGGLWMRRIVRGAS